MSKAKTLVDKIWQAHRVDYLEGGSDLLHVDRIVLHERSGGRMLEGVLSAGRQIYDPQSVYATIDHIIDTDPGRGDHTRFPGGREFIEFFRDNASRGDVEIFDISDPRQGIVHVMAPELGVAQPGLTMVCGDSHTSTLGGMGALAWGIGVTQGEHALCTQCLPVKRPKQMRIHIEEELRPGVTPKDIVLHLIGQHGATGGKGYAIEFAGSVMRAMSPEGRMTLCNMAVEFGGWTGIVAPDEKVFSYLQGTQYAPQGEDWDEAMAYWKTLYTDSDALFESEIKLDVSELRPQITWGTSSEHVAAVDGRVPDPEQESERVRRNSMRQAMEYMQVQAGDPLSGMKIDAAFIGSCTNSRIEDLRLAASLLKGQRVADGVTALCVPGSSAVKRQAESEGLDRIFIEAGFEWREAGCSLCFFAGGEAFPEGSRVVSTTNRNFQNRQGPKVKTHLASPLTVAASAVAGRIADPGSVPRGGQ